MSEQLKPCPFCGSAAGPETQFNYDFWVQCTNMECGATDGKLYETQAEAIEQWNRRAPISAPTTAIKDSLATGATIKESLQVAGGDRQSIDTPVLYFKRLTGAECKPDGRCYDAVFSPMPGYEPLYSCARSAGDAVPAGFKLVPLEPTDDMVVAFAETWFSKVRPIDDCGMEDCYAAMLGVAPAPGNTEKPGLDAEPQTSAQFSALGKEE